MHATRSRLSNILIGSSVSTDYAKITCNLAGLQKVQYTVTMVRQVVQI